MMGGMVTDTPMDDRTPSSAHIARCLAAITGRKHVVLNPPKRSDGEPPSDVVVQPADANEVSAILQYAVASRVPVFPTTSDAVAPIRGAVLLDLRRMTRVIDVDEANGICIVEPAVPITSLQRTLSPHGLFYAPDPLGLDEHTIGAAVARGAEGPCAMKYGGTRHHVVALEVVLPTGEVLRTGPRALRPFGGYDLTRFFVGTVGTLGVFTRLTLRATPVPERALTVCAGFPTSEAAAAAAAAVVGRHMGVAALTFMDLDAFAGVELMQRIALGDSARAVLVAEIHGAPEEADRTAAALREVADGFGSTDWTLAESRRERASLWEPRRRAPSVLATLAAHVRRIEVSLLPSRLGELIGFIGELRGRTAVPVACFGSVGTGGLTVCLPHHDDAHSRREADDAAQALMGFVGRLGGAAEDSEGTRPDLAVPAVERKIMRQLKDLFDPAGILSPATGMTKHE